VPYRAKRLTKNELHAVEVSSVGGELFRRFDGNRVFMRGRARLVSDASLRPKPDP
jgi:diaminopimelate epimerase